MDDCLFACGNGSADGSWCFEHSELAEILLRRASEAGADVRKVRCLPQPAGTTCDAFVDATGRTAAWSGPVRRYGREIADIYEVSLAHSATQRNLVATDWFWAYYLSATSTASAVVITRHGRNTPTAAKLAFEKLNINPKGVRFVGRRFCSPQWAEKVIDGNRVSVGDAAFAYYPLAGMGVRFAAATAMAAAALLQTRWECPEFAGIADEYYVDLCEAARTAHLVNLAGSSGIRRTPGTGPLVFTAREIQMGVLRGDLIVPEKGYLLPDGSRVRWVGGLDLTYLRQISSVPISKAELAERLVSVLGSRSNVNGLIDWCIGRHVLASSRL